MKRKSFDACLSFVNTGVSGGESGIRRRERTCVAIDGRIGGGLRGFINTPIFTVS